MGKRVVTTGLVIVVLLGLPVLVAAVLPAGLFIGSLGKGINLVPLGYAALIRGKGALISRDGTDILNWAWCPLQGMTSLCVDSSGKNGFFQGVIAFSVGEVKIHKVKFARLDAALMMIPGLAAGGRLSGELHNLTYDWADRCPHRGLISAAGELVLSGLAGGDYRVTVNGDGEQGFALSGDYIEGHLDVVENSVTGVLTMAGPAQSNNRRHSMEVNVARHIGCRS